LKGASGRMNDINNLQMLTCDQVAEIFHVHKNQVNIWRETGILKGIRTGRNIMYSQDEIRAFQARFNGYDISNRTRIKETLERIKTGVQHEEKHI
jgi:hypothetical protein